MCSKQTETDFNNKWGYKLNYPFYLDEYMSNVEADLEFSKAIDVRLMQCVHISIFMFYASIEET